MKNTTVLAALSASAIALLAPFSGISAPAAAHTACRVDFPFGSGWTEGCPHPHVPTDSGSTSCLAVYTSPAEYKVSNRTNHDMSYKMNGTSYRLGAGRYRTHSIGGGSNGCNTVSTDGRITFDWSYQSGYQEESYVLRRSDNASVYYFSKLSNGNGLDLYRETSN